VTTWIALFILALGAIMLVSDDSGMIVGLDATTFGYLALMLALLVYLAGGLMTRYAGGASAMVRDAVTWIALGLGLVTLYAYKEELTPLAARVVGELLPGTAMTVEESANGLTEVKIRRRLDGHFTATIDVNNKPISMIVDTGASSIVLRPEDAKRAGIDIDKLTFRIPVLTANGRTMAARVHLNKVGIGPLDRTKVEALVAKPGALTQSLLGMSFLSRLRSYEFSGDFREGRARHQSSRHELPRTAQEFSDPRQRARPRPIAARTTPDIKRQAPRLDAWPCARARHGW
jgi:aspartyl protease family protein